MQTTRITIFPPTPETTLSAIALRSDAHATVLDRYKLDFCCRGSRSLQEACRGAGLDVDRVLAELTAQATAREEVRSAGADWQARTPDELIDFIVSTHHEYTRAAFARLAPLAAKVAGKHRGRHPELPRYRRDRRAAGRRFPAPHDEGRARAVPLHPCPGYAGWRAARALRDGQKSGAA